MKELYEIFLDEDLKFKLTLKKMNPTTGQLLLQGK